MKKYIYVIIIALTAISCDDFLDTEDLTNKNSQNFPKTANDCNQSLAAAYYPMSQWIFNAAYIGALASDEGFGAGAANDYDCHGFDRWRESTPNMAQDFWQHYYAGIYRINKLIESIDNVQFKSASEKKMIVGEAHFLRAFYYSELVKVFGEVPLILSAAKPVNIPKSSAIEIYSQVTTDLKLAIDFLPNDKYNVNPDRFGHGTKWAAESLMAKVFLFYTGYYKQESLPLIGGGVITKTQVISYIEDVINNSGHILVPDFRNLWPYTHSQMKEDYAYTKGKKLNWVGDNNSETVFAIKYGSITTYGQPCNVSALFFGIRGQTNLTNVFPFGDGYGQAAINPLMVQKWIAEEPNDTIRRWGSIIDVDNVREGIRKYQIGGWNMVEETKLFIKKYSLIHCYTDKTNADSTKWKLAVYDIVSNGTTRPDASTQDQVLIRYSDVLLMHSELTGTADNMNLVRARAGLLPLAYTIENLRKERLYELAFEGIRYYDLLRWYGKEAGVVIDQNQNGANVLNDKIPGKYTADLGERIRITGGFMQIPEAEISLSNGVLIQNIGWSGEGINLQ